MRVGEWVCLIDGKGCEASACIEAISRTETTLLVQKLSHKEAPQHSWTLALALIRPAKLELALEKATELGIDHFQLFVADFSETTKISSDRFEAIFQGACKQSGRLFMPTVEILKALTLPSGPFFYGSLDAKATPLQEVPSKLTFFIGPEGGFSDREQALLTKGTGIRLGEHILRAETAAIAAAALIASGL